MDVNHELVLLAQKLDRQSIETGLSGYYSKVGQPSVSIRLMVGCPIPKQLYNLGDETLAKVWNFKKWMRKALSWLYKIRWNTGTLRQYWNFSGQSKPPVALIVNQELTPKIAPFSFSTVPLGWLFSG